MVYLLNGNWNSMIYHKKVRLSGKGQGGEVGSRIRQMLSGELKNGI